MPSRTVWCAPPLKEALYKVEGHDKHFPALRADMCPHYSFGRHGWSPAAKRYLVNIRLKISPLVTTVFRRFSGNETSNLGDWVAKWYCGNILDIHAGLPEKNPNPNPNLNSIGQPIHQSARRPPAKFHLRAASMQVKQLKFTEKTQTQKNAEVT